MWSTRLRSASQASGRQRYPLHRGAALRCPRVSARLHAVPVGIGDLEPEALVEPMCGGVLTVDLEKAGLRALPMRPTQDRADDGGPLAAAAIGLCGKQVEQADGVDDENAEPAGDRTPVSFDQHETVRPLR